MRSGQALGPGELRVAIVGAGSGGHVYPAVAIAEAMKALDDRIEVHFVGTRRRYRWPESPVAPPPGYPFHTLLVGRLNRHAPVRERMETLLKLPLAFTKSLWILARVRPKLVLGVGGAESGPLVLLAAVIGIPTAIWEPNAWPGFTNRRLSRFVDLVFLVHDEAAGRLRARSVAKAGVPLRSVFRSAPSSVERESLHLLVLGGSQGAPGLNKVVREACGRDTDWLHGVRVVHQTGRLEYEVVRDCYDALPPTVRDRIEVRDYLMDVHRRLEWADLVVCRGGASTLAELAACGRAAIVVPLGDAADNHQHWNADAFRRAGAVSVIAEDTLTPESFVAAVREFQHDRELLRALERNVRRLHRSHAAQGIAERLLTMLPPSRDAGS